MMTAATLGQHGTATAKARRVGARRVCRTAAASGPVVGEVVPVGFDPRVECDRIVRVDPVRE